MKWLTSRRQFSAALVGLSQKSERRVDGRIVDESHLMGHKLRDGAKFAAPKEQIRIPVVIVGGGVSGLSAAWQLERRGFRDFVVLEMERDAGGNSRSGENEVSAYPWGAHYLPVPNRDAKLVRELCEEFGLRENGRWNERHLCHSPQERLFLHGRWQEGLEPEIAVPAHERQQFRRFDQQMKEFAKSGGFTIPVDTGWKASPLDAVSMDTWLREQKYTSPSLYWYVNYACRDDYGADLKNTSAWAGIHYFASREHDDKGPFTWPEGNGWLIKQLLRKLGRFVHTGSMVTRIDRRDGRFRIVAGDKEYVAQAVIWAGPTFTLRYVYAEAPDVSGMVYSPWITANLTLDRLPKENGAEMAWDNVIFNSPSLGYVSATHQSLRRHVDRTVWTWYHAVVDRTPSEARKMLLEKDWGYWKEFLLSDLERAHPDIRQCVSRVDVMRFGHAMARPVPGWMSNEKRRRLASWGDGIYLANSDLSGLSIFEEAQYRGVEAANRVMRRLGCCVGQTSRSAEGSPDPDSFA